MRPYLLLVVVETLSGMGSSLTAFVITLWAWRTSHSARVLTDVMALLFLPNLLITPVAGVFVDRWRRKPVLMATNALNAGAVVWLAFTLAAGRMSYGHVLAFGAVSALMTAFRRPTLDASMVLLVPSEARARATALAQTLMSSSEMASMLLCGLLIGWLPQSALLALDAATFVLAAAGALAIRIPDARAAAAPTAPAGIVADLAEAAAFIRRHRPLVCLAAASALFNLIGGAFIGALLLPMASTVWRDLPEARHVGGWMKALGANTGGLDAQLAAFVTTLCLIGSFVGGLIMSARGRPWRSRLGDFFLGATLVGLCQLLLGAHSLVVSGAAAFAMGLVAPLIHISANTIWMQKTPTALQGRVFALFILVAQVTYPLGLVLVGALSRHATPSQLLVGSGVAFAVNAIAWSLSAPLRRLDELVPDPAPPSAALVVHPSQ